MPTKPKKDPPARFAVCVDNRGYEASLELHKIYPLVADSEALRDGDIDALILQDPYKMGYLGVWNLVHHLEGSTIEPKVMSTGEYVVTKDNLDDQSTRELFDPKLQEQRKIESPAFKKKIAE